MKRISLVFIATLFSAFSIAQNVTPQSWSSFKRVSLNYEYFDLATTANQDVFVAGGGAASGFNFSIVKYDSSGTILFTKSYVSRNQGVGKIDIDSNEDLFVVSSFSSVFELGTDTFTTSRTSDDDLFVGKFDGQTGDDIWVKNYSRDDFLYAQILPNDNYLLKLEAYQGEFVFGGDTITTITARSEVFLYLDGANGNVLNHYVLSYLGNDGRLQNFIEGTTLTYYDIIATFGGGNKYLRRNVLDLTNGVVLLQDSSRYQTQYARPERSYSKNGQGGSAYNSQTKELYLAVSVGADFLYIGTDSLGASESAVLRLDSNMNVLQFVRTEVPITKMLLQNGHLVMSGMHTPNNISSSVWFDNDTIPYPNSQRSHLIVSSNLDFTTKKYAFMATDSWQTGLELLNLEIDNAGNVYALGWHQNDILFSPFTAQSLNRSWKHNSAFGKFNSGQTTNLGDIVQIRSELNFKVYPNPFKNSIKLEMKGRFEYKIFSTRGQLLHSGNSTNFAELNLGKLPKGMYLIQVVENGSVGMRRIIKG